MTVKPTRAEGREGMGFTYEEKDVCRVGDGEEVGPVPPLKKGPYGQRRGWLDGIMDAMDMSLSKLGDSEGQGPRPDESAHYRPNTNLIKPAALFRPSRRLTSQIS